MKEIIYTDTARERLQYLHNKIDNQIEDYFRSTKYNLGDDFVEITASDIEDVGRMLKIIRPYKSTYMKSFLVYFFIVIGALLTIFGIFYDSIIDLFKEGNTVRLLLILYGFGLVLSGIFYRFIIKQRKTEERIHLESLRRKDIIEKYGEMSGSLDEE